MDDPINHPAHYTKGNYEVIDIIEDWDLGYHLGNAVKYIARCRYKGNLVQDLDKAIWYLARYRDQHKKQEAANAGLREEREVK